MKRPDRKSYDLNDIFECVKFIRDNEQYVDYLEERDSNKVGIDVDEELIHAFKKRLKDYDRDSLIKWIKGDKSEYSQGLIGIAKDKTIPITKTVDPSFDLEDAINVLRESNKKIYLGGSDSPSQYLYINIKNNNNLSDLQKMDVAEALDIEMKKFKEEIITEIDKMLDNLNLRKKALIGMRELSLSNEAQIFSYNNIKSLILSK